jgi:sodium-dependent dicarboxylate transporter 2/3/5
MGGFTLAALLNKHGIDRWLADKVTTMSNGNLWVSVIGFFAVTSFLSMWMSNTATTAMMIPIAIALVNKEYPRMRTMILLGTAYSANIGGNGTAVGSPPNGLAVSALDIDFFTWFKVGFPTALVLFPLVIIALWFVIRPEKDAKVNRLSDSHSMNWTSEAKGTIGLFLFTVICWIFSSQIGSSLGLKNFDRMIAILITALAPAFKLITWKDLEDKIGWGILLLFGGGLCLSVVLGDTGTSLWLATALINSISTPWIIIFACITLMVFLTELSSNTGSAAILIPVMIALSNQFDPAVTYALVFGVGLAANCAFMLPVATPPNALVYGTGYINQKDMIKTGIILNIFSIFVVYTMVTLLT